MIKTIMVCDQCGKEEKEETAENWIDVISAGRRVVTYSAAYSYPDIHGLYCSTGCLSEKIAAKTAEIKDLVENGTYRWQGLEYKLT